MNLYRLRLLASVLLATTLVLSGCGVLSLDCDSALCRFLGIAHHRVVSLQEYAEYLRGADISTPNGALSYSFDCDSIRKQFAERITQTMVEETALARTKQSRTAATVSGRSLRIENSYAPSLDKWAEETRAELAQDPADRLSGWQIAAMRRLFDSIILNKDGKEVEIKMTEAYACDGKRKVK